MNTMPAQKRRFTWDDYRSWDDGQRWEIIDGETYRFVAGYTKGDTLISPTFPEVRIDLDRIFDFPIPPEQRIEMVREGTPPSYGSEVRSDGG